MSYEGQGSVANVVNAWDGTQHVWTKLFDVHVDAAAAISGTKINPNFGTQTIRTTAPGHITLGPGTEPAAGDIRFAQNTARFEARNVALTDDVTLFNWGAGKITIGANDVDISGGIDLSVPTGTSITSIVAGTARFTVQAAQLIAGTSVSIFDFLNAAGVDIRTNAGAHLGLFRSGTVRNLAIFQNGVTVVWNSGDRITYLLDRIVAPTAAPVGGFYWWSEAGIPMYRTTVAAGDFRFRLPSAVTVTAGVGSNGVLPATVEGYVTVQIQGTDRKMAFYPVA